MSSPTSNRNEHLKALDRAHHLHPFTDYADLGRKGSRIITRAEGVYLYDSDGNRLLDGMAGLWCVNVGYGREELVDEESALPVHPGLERAEHRGRDVALVVEGK